MTPACRSSGITGSGLAPAVSTHVTPEPVHSTRLTGDVEVDPETAAMRQFAAQRELLAKPPWAREAGANDKSHSASVHRCGNIARVSDTWSEAAGEDGMTDSQQLSQTRGENWRSHGKSIY